MYNEANVYDKIAAYGVLLLLGVTAVGVASDIYVAYTTKKGSPGS